MNNITKKHIIYPTCPFKKKIPIEMANNKE